MENEVKKVMGSLNRNLLQLLDAVRLMRKQEQLRNKDILLFLTKIPSTKHLSCIQELQVTAGEILFDLHEYEREIRLEEEACGEWDDSDRYDAYYCYEAAVYDLHQIHIVHGITSIGYYNYLMDIYSEETDRDPTKYWSKEEIEDYLAEDYDPQRDMVDDQDPLYV